MVEKHKIDAAALFREEIFHERADRVGTPVFVPIRVPSGAIVSATSTFVFLLAAFVFTASFSTKVIATGFVTVPGGVETLKAPMSGFLEVVDVKDGAAVPPERTLFVIKDAGRTSAGSTVGAAIMSADDANLAGTVKANIAQLEMLNNQLEDAQARERSIITRRATLFRQEKIQRSIYDNASTTAQRYQSLLDRGYGSPIQVAQALATQETAELTLTNLEDQEQQNELAYKQVGLEISKDRVAIIQFRESAKSTEAALKGKIIENGTAHEARISAQRGGKVSGVLVTVGSRVNQGDVLATIVPLGRRPELQIWLPTNAIGNVTVGAPVKIQYDSYPFQQYGLGDGKIARIAMTPTPPSSLPEIIGQKSAMLSATVDLRDDFISHDSRRFPVTPGMTASAIVVTSKQTLLQWLKRGLS